MDRINRFNLNQPVPLLFVGDGCDGLTGLGRLGHDLAWLASSMPEFQVGYMGRQLFGRSRFPWTCYSFSAAEQWGEERIEEAWRDLAGTRKGIIMTLWDASRLLWFADPRATGERLEKFLREGNFERWGYFMADGAGVNPATLPLEQSHVIGKYQRAVMASRWAYSLLGGIEGPELDWIPHPINRETFQRIDPLYARSGWGVSQDDIVIGCVMANQARKHWPVMMEAVATLSQTTKTKPRLWVHTDALTGHWNLAALAVEYGIENQILWENKALTDRELAMRYSACNATVVVSGGEGFCYPVAESLSCGTPVITGTYGAHAELTRWVVAPAHTAIETNHNVRRAYYTADSIAFALQVVLAEQPSADKCEDCVRHLNMKQLGVLWKKWFRKGLI